MRRVSAIQLSLCFAVKRASYIEIDRVINGQEVGLSESVRGFNFLKRPFYAFAVSF